MSRSLTSSSGRREYHHVLEVIEKNTGGEQPAMASATSITQIAALNGVEDPGKRLRAAIENGDALRWDGRVARIDEPSIEAVRDAEIARDYPDTDLIGRCNGLLQDLREADE